MRWWAYCQPLAQGRIVQQDAPWSTIAPGGQVEGRAITRHHTASLLAIDQRRIPAIAGDQLVEIGPHHGADRKSVGWGTSVYYRVDPGGRRNRKTKTNYH